MKKSTVRRGRKRGPLKLFLTYSFIFFLLLLFAGTLGGGAFGYFYLTKLARELPDVMSLKEYKPSLITRVFDDNGRLISEFYVEKRILLSSDKIPALIKNATIAVEDSSFYTHRGINFRGIFRAMIANIRAGSVVEGGSTITQQLTKTMFLTPERKIRRKLKELILALKIEKNFSKEEIIEIYLNQIYYGHGAYGVEAAAQTYFGKSVDQLGAVEISLIAGLPKAPTAYSPYFSPEKAKKRRNHVLRRLREEGYISSQAHASFVKSPLLVKERETKKTMAPYFTEYVRQYLEKKYGSTRLYRSGLNVYTTLDLDYQLAAEAALQRGVETTDRRLGYRGPIGSVELSHNGEVDWNTVSELLKKRYPDGQPYEASFKLGGVVPVVVSSVKKGVAAVEIEGGKGKILLRDTTWAHKRDHTKDARRVKKIDSLLGVLKEGDVVWGKITALNENDIYTILLKQYPLVQAALVSLDPETGFIRAMVGGYDFSMTKFNRAVQAKRQPGSAFKPLIYSAAIEKGFTPASVFIDSPVIFEDEDKKNWKPRNFEMRFYGPVTLRSALTHSRNVVTVKLLQKIGLEYVVEYASRFKLSGNLKADMSLALGTSEVTPMEITSMYGVFANKGVYAPPMAVNYITDRAGDVIEVNSSVPVQIITPQNAYLVASMLQSVVQNGTGRRAKVLKRPAGAKTGTTNDFIDAWFVGFTPGLATGVWVGMDYHTPMGKNETGSRAASPIWVDFMKKALKGSPVRYFEVPENIVVKKINKKTGFLALPSDPDAVFESFRADNAPVKYTNEESETRASDEHRL